MVFHIARAQQLPVNYLGTYIPVPDTGYPLWAPAG